MSTGWCSFWECPHLHFARNSGQPYSLVYRVVLFVGVPTFTFSPPRVNVEALPSNKPPVTNLLRPARGESVCIYVHMQCMRVEVCVCVCVCVSVCVWRMYVFKCECVTLPSFVWQSQYISLHNAGRGALPDPQFTVSAPRSLPPSAKEITAKRPQKCYTRTHNTLSKNNWTGSKKRLKGATLIPGTVIFLRHDQA